MTPTPSLNHRLDDRVNPITVRDLRQIMARGFGYVPPVIAIWFALLTGWLLLHHSHPVTVWDPESFIGFTLTGHVGACVGWLPMAAHIRLLQAQAQNDLTFTTTLSPGVIIRGTWFAGLVASAAIYFTALPFLAVILLVEGVAATHILLLFGGTWIIIAAGMLFAIAAACLGRSPTARGYAALLAISVVTAGTAYCLAGWFENALVWPPLLIVTLPLMGLFYVIGVAGLKPPSANRAMPVRTYITAAWAITAAACFAWSWRTADAWPVLIWAIVSTAVLCIALLAAVSERERINHRLARSLPASRDGRAAAFLFHSGSAGGLTWTLLLLAATVATALPAFEILGGPAALPLILARIALYTAAVCLTALLVRRALLRNDVAPGQTWLLALLLLPALLAAPYALALLLPAGRLGEAISRSVITPLLMLFDPSPHGVGWTPPLAWTLAALALLTPYLINRFRAFQRIGPEGERPPAAPESASPPISEPDQRGRPPRLPSAGPHTAAATAGPAPTALARLGRWADDRLNPLMLHNLRAATSGAKGSWGTPTVSFTWPLMCFLGWLILMSLERVVVTRLTTGSWDLAGSSANLILFMTAVTIIFGMLGVSTIAIVRFRDDANDDAESITPLSPGTVVRGRLLTGLVFAVLIYSIYIPFALLAYMLGGVDPLDLLMVIGLACLASGTGIMALIFLLSVPANKLLTMLMLAAFGLLFFFILVPASVTLMLVDAGLEAVMEFITAPLGPGTWAPVLLLALLLFGLLYVLSVAAVKPRAANRTLPVRAYITAAWAVSGLACFAWAGRTGDASAVAIWLAFHMIVLCIALLAAISERDRIGPRIAATIPTGTIRRHAAFLFYSGSAGGVAWTLLMLAATFTTATLWRDAAAISAAAARFPIISDLDLALRIFPQFALYVAAYGLTAMWLRRWPVFRTPPKHTYAVALVLMAIGSLMPNLFIAIDLAQRPVYTPAHDALGYGYWFLTAPLTLFRDSPTGALWWWFPALWTVAALLANLPALAAQYRAFRRPLEPEGSKPQIPARRDG